MPPSNDKISKKKKSSKKSLSTFIKNQKLRLKYLYEFSFVVIVYGSLLSFVFATLMAHIFQFNLKYLLAMGIGFYFLKEEIPRIIGKSFPPRL